MKKIAIITSGNSRNAERLVNLFNEGNRIRVDVVVTDRENAPVRERMEKIGVETIYYPREVWTGDPARISRFFDEHDIDLILADGFSQLIPATMVECNKGKLLMLHAPVYGQHAPEVSISYAENEMGEGRVIMKQGVEETAGMTEEEFAERVDDIEANILPRAIVTAFREIDAVEKSSSEEGDAETEVRIPPIPAKEVDALESEWAKVLGIKYDPAQVAVTPPPVPKAESASAESNLNMQDTSPAKPDSRMQEGGGNEEPMPATYLVWSVLCTVLCCFIPGIVAIIFSSQVSSRYLAGDVEGAKRASRNAEIWIIVSFVLGVLSATLYLPFMLVAS